MSFNLTKEKKTAENVVKTCIDRDNDELNLMRRKLMEDCKLRIKAIKKEMIKLSNEEDRCERYLESLKS
jgi:polyhydroxyalkanoate synthesis regulator phasin